MKTAYEVFVAPDPDAKLRNFQKVQYALVATITRKKTMSTTADQVMTMT